MIVAAETATVFAPGLVSAFAADTAKIGSAMNTAVVAQIAGLPVVEGIAIHTGVTQGSMIVIEGVPILIELVVSSRFFAKTIFTKLVKPLKDGLLY